MHSKVRSCTKDRGKLEAIVVTVLRRFTPEHWWLTCGFSIVFLGSSSAQSNPVIACQISRLRMPRASATEPTRNPNLRRGVQAGPLRAPQPRAREKTNGRRRKACQGLFKKGQMPEIGIPPSDHATRRHTKVHLDFCLRFSTLIGQIGRVPLFGAGPRRYIRSRLFRLAVTVFWRVRTASWRQKGERKQVFPRGAIRTTELPSNPSPLST